MKEIKVLSLGDIIWDIYDDRKCMGGAGLNFAAHVARLGAKSYMLSCLGNDALGKEALGVIKSYNVIEKYVSFNDKKTGQCIVTLDENKVPSFSIISDVAFDYLKIDDSLFKENFDALSFGSVTFRGKDNFYELKKIVESKICKNLFYDINLRKPFFDNETIRYSMENSNILKVSEDELSYIMKNIVQIEEKTYIENLKEVYKSFPNFDIILLTCGENGAYAYECKKDAFTYQESFKVKVVSTVGAGDCFGATFLVNYLKGCSIKECLYQACKASSIVVSKMEAI